MFFLSFPQIFTRCNISKVKLGLLRPCTVKCGPSSTARMGQNRLLVEPCSKDGLGKLLLGKLHIWEVFTWVNTLVRLPLKKKPLGNCTISIKHCKFPWNVFTTIIVSVLDSETLVINQIYGLLTGEGTLMAQILKDKTTFIDQSLEQKERFPIQHFKWYSHIILMINVM